MAIWLDNHLSPALAAWLSEAFGEPCVQVRDLDLATASDAEIFEAASKDARVIVSKDRDFAELVARRGPPPAIVLLTCGNTSTQFLKTILGDRWEQALALIAGGESLVEIGLSDR